MTELNTLYKSRIFAILSIEVNRTIPVNKNGLMILSGFLKDIVKRDW
ncbi:MAG TPA: hypothetical protein VEP90_22005 [Methylomirabilota bacterium]|nr:hypothetical protein [Methylomirabilota bacterium]